MVDFGVGFAIAASCCAIYQIMSTAFAGNAWVLNPKITAPAILEGSRWTLVSVLYEELIFRGALLYIAIKKLGVKRACILSAICFGVYHWFTFNAFGNPLMMTFTFLMTGIVGFSWAYSFAKTSSLYLPIALHFGWNLINMVVFSNGQMVQSILMRENDNMLLGTVSILVFLFQVFAMPLLIFWYLHRISQRDSPLAEHMQPLRTDI
jgi:membrane protease YdiL (CAAX protease family)